MSNEPLGGRAIAGLFAFAALFFWFSHINDNVLYAVCAWFFLLCGLSVVLTKIIRRSGESLGTQEHFATGSPKTVRLEAELLEFNRRREADGLGRERRFDEDDVERVRRQANDRLTNAHRREAEQSGVHFWMEKSGQDALEGFLALPERLQEAESLLDQADSQFTEGAFAPFWDSIESAANELGKFKNEVAAVKDNLALYMDMAEKCDGTPPPFPVSRESIRKLTVSTGTVQRLQSVVGMAQRDFQFSVIFEQRKTNQLLVAGFRDLADGLRQIGSQVELATDSLVRSMDGLHVELTVINSSLGDVIDEVGAVKAGVLEVGHGVAELRHDVSTGFDGVRARQVAALRMLDSIQRRRRPAIFEQR